MEVQMAWLDLDKEDKAKAPPPSSRRGPPKLPGLPDIPPMPVVSSVAPPRRHTIDVEMQWVELVDDASKEEGKRDSEKPAKTAAKKSDPPAEARPRKSQAPRAPAPVEAPAPSSRGVRARPIIPREEE
jgi:hypothetical protein